MLADLEPHPHESLLQIAHLVALVPVDAVEFGVKFGVLEDVVEGEGVTLCHDIVVADEALVKVDHALAHL